MSSDSWCVLPFAHINIKPYGHFGACWRNLSDLGSYETGTLREAWNGPRFQELRRQLSQGEKPVGCRSCWDMEAAGTVSTRQQANKDYNKFIQALKNPLSPIQPYRWELIEIRFNNECNLMCRHCNPFNSSQLDQLGRKNREVAELFKDHVNYKAGMVIPRLPPEIVEELCVEVLPHTKHIMMTGGEPFLQPEHLEMLKKLQPVSSTKTLEYNSNLHVLAYKGEDFIKYWKNYEKVTLRVSIDGDRETYDYFRVNGKFERVEKNIALLKEAFGNTDERLFLQATCTTSLFQITRLGRIIRCFNDLGVYFHSSLTQYPRAINIQQLPKTLRLKVQEEIHAFLESFEHDESLWKHPFWNSSHHRGRQVKRIRLYVGRILDYIKASTKEDDGIEEDTRKWVETLDRAHGGARFLEIYPEFTPYWGGRKDLC